MNEQDLIQVTHDVEQAFLGSLLIDRDAMPAVNGVVIPEAFRWDSHRVLFTAMQRLWADRTPCDVTNAISEIRAMGYGEDRFPAEYLGTLMSAVPTAVHVAYYGDRVMQFARRRAIASAGAKIVQAAYGDEETTDTGELVANLRNAVEPFEPKDENGTIAIADLAVETARDTLDFFEGRRQNDAISTGIVGLDAMLTGGFRPGQLIVVGARPGMGKSSLMVQLAIRNRSHIVSLEMTRTEIMNRIISLYGKIPYRIAHDQIADIELRDRWIVAANAAGMLPITVSDKSGQTTTQIEAEVEQRIVSDDIQMVIIDHLDWIGDKIKTESPEVRTAALVNRCKAMAKACRIPVVLLAQLNRNVEHRPGFFPYLSDFRNSGAVEQDADIAILLYRRAYYTSRGMLTPDVNEDLLPGSNLEKAEIIVAKNRNGSIGTLNVGWNPHTMSFREDRRAA